MEEAHYYILKVKIMILILAIVIGFCFGKLMGKLIVSTMCLIILALRCIFKVIFSAVSWIGSLISNVICFFHSMVCRAYQKYKKSY
jgi:hypothetical protein